MHVPRTPLFGSLTPHDTTLYALVFNYRERPNEIWITNLQYRWRRIIPNVSILALDDATFTAEERMAINRTLETVSPPPVKAHGKPLIPSALFGHYVKDEIAEDLVAHIRERELRYMNVPYMLTRIDHFMALIHANPRHTFTRTEFTRRKGKCTMDEVHFIINELILRGILEQVPRRDTLGRHHTGYEWTGASEVFGNAGPGWVWKEDAMRTDPS